MHSAPTIVTSPYRAAERAEHDTAFHLRFDDPRIDHLAAVDDTEDFVHLEITAHDRDFLHSFPIIDSSASH